MAKVRSEKWLRLNKKLRLPNIVIMIISLAALCLQLFLPFLDMSVRTTGAELAPHVEALMQSMNPDGGSSGGSSGEPDMTAMIMESLDEVGEISLSVKVSPLAMLSVATGDETAFGGFVESMLPTNEYLQGTLEEVISAVLPSMMASMLLEGAADTLGQNKVDLYEAQIIDSFEKLEESNFTEARRIYRETVTALLYDMNGTTPSTDDVEQYMDTYNKIEAWGTTEEGTFSYLTLIMHMDTSEFTGEPSTGEDPLAMLKEIVADPVGYISDMVVSMLTATDEGATPIDFGTIQLAFLIGFIAFGAFPALLWLILALFAFGHIFAKNKKVAMWYVKLVNVWPFLLFVLLPTLTMAFMPQLFSLVGITGMESYLSMVTAMHPTFLGSGIYTMICYLALWCVSIFWCHPIKKQIKREVKLQKALAKQQKNK